MLCGKKLIAVRLNWLCLLSVLLVSGQVMAAPLKAMVFISSAMPERTLQQFSEQAKGIGAPLVLRGLVNNSMTETVAFLKNTLGKDMDAVVIDPEAFARYRIDKVPAVIVTDEVHTEGVFGAVHLRESLGRIYERREDWATMNSWCGHLGGCSHHAFDKNQRGFVE